MNQARRQYYLDAIGIQNWQLKSSTDDPYCQVDTIEISGLSVPELPEVKAAPLNSFQSAPQLSSEPALKQDPKPQPAPEPKVITKELHEKKETQQASVKDNKLINEIPVSALEQSINACKLCPSRQTRLNALSGFGAEDARIFVISEPPNAEEDRNGQYLNEQTKPLLDAMFSCINLQDEFFFSGIIKCHSPTDYLFSDEEITHCGQFLHAQIEQVKPEVIMVFGAAQAQAILQTKDSFNQLRGQIHQVTINSKQYQLIVSYHPAYLLRNPLYKREALKDLLMLRQLLS